MKEIWLKWPCEAQYSIMIILRGVSVVTLVIIETLTRLLHISPHFRNLSIHILFHLAFSFRTCRRLRNFWLLINSWAILVIHLHTAAISCGSRCFKVLWWLAEEESFSWSKCSLLQLLILADQLLVARKEIYIYDVREIGLGYDVSDR